MPRPQQLYWDSCAWLGPINGETDKKRELGIVYSQSKRGFFEIWTSAISVLEVRRLADEQNQRKPLDPKKLEKLDELFLQPFIKVVPNDLQISRAARKIWRETDGLNKHWDAIHLATAIQWNIEVLHTYDRKDLLHLNGLLRCRNGNPLNICYPDETTDGALFAKKS